MGKHLVINREMFKLRHWFINFINSKNRSLTGKIFYTFLITLSYVYQVLLKLRNMLYDKGILKSYAFDKNFVIDVGNITWGGTGKTSLVSYLYRMLQKETSVAVLTKGYARDEYLLLKHTLGNVFDAKDRARFINTNKEKFHIFILDDSFQYRKIQANLDIVVVNYSDLRERNRLIPAGSMREEWMSLRRADIVVVNHFWGDELGKDEVRQFLIRFNPELKIFFMKYKLKRIISLDNTETVSKEYFSQHPTGVLTAIGYPQGVVSLLEYEGILPQETVFLPDHTFINDKILSQIEGYFKKQGVVDIIITYKDRFHTDFRNKTLNYYILDIDVCIDDSDVFEKIIRERCGLLRQQ